jgi:hypothetical protein
MESRRKIIPIAIVVLMAFLLAPQLQSADAGGKSPYESGYDHGCDDADKDFEDRYINQPEKGPSFHTDAFMKGYNAGYAACPSGSGSEDNDNDKTYCNVPNPSNPCHDRKDYSDTTGLYTCIDGSHEANWRDCTGGGSNNDDEGSNDNDSDDLPQDAGCQGSDDYCDSDDGCRSESVDCIDDRNFDEDDYNG